MFKTDKQKFLVEFVEKHPDLNENEREIIFVTVEKLNEKNISQYREITHVTNALHKLSLSGKLSDDGRKLLKELHQKDWFMGLLDNLRLFGN